jgi:hypothetical protein
MTSTEGCHGGEQRFVELEEFAKKQSFDETDWAAAGQRKAHHVRRLPAPDLEPY